jgi:hypothetical protein
MAKASPLTSDPADAEIVRLLKASDESGLRALLKVHGQAVLDILTRKHGYHVAADAMNRAALLISMEMGAKYKDGKGTRTRPTAPSTPPAVRHVEKFAPRWSGWGTSPTKPGGATMAEENAKFWKDAKGKLRRAFNLDPMCREEAEAEVKRTKNSNPLIEKE